MSYHYRNWSPEQIALLPVNPRDWLDEDHLAFSLLEAMTQFDLQAFHGKRSLDGRGCPGYDPIMMAALVLYCLLCRCVSSRKMARFCRNDLGARFLCGAAGVPEYRCLGSFRKRNQKALAALFAQSVTLCQEAGLVDHEALFFDGSPFKASASPRKNMRYGKADAEIEVLEMQFQDLFAQADELDRIEGESENPEPPQDPESRAKRLLERKECILRAKAQMEEEARQAKAKWEATPAKERPHVKAPSGTPDAKDRANLTDPESRLMKLSNGGYAQAYNANIAVEPSHQIIVGASLSADCTDYAQLEPTLDSVEQTLGVCPETAVADGGYLSNHNLTLLEERKIEALISPNRKLPPIESTSPAQEPDAPTAVSSGKAKSAAQIQMLQVFATQPARDLYAKRKSTVEPVFGQIKGGCGHPGMTGFLVRGLQNCRDHWLLSCAIHNLGKWIRHKSKQRNATKQPRPSRVRVVANFRQLVLETTSS